MSQSELLDRVLLPIALLTEYRVAIWPLLLSCVCWLYWRHYFRPTSAIRFSLAVWRGLSAIGLLALSSVIVLIVISPDGAGYYRVAVGTISAIPLILPMLLSYMVRPKILKR